MSKVSTKVFDSMVDGISDASLHNLTDIQLYFLACELTDMLIPAEGEEFHMILSQLDLVRSHCCGRFLALVVHFLTGANDIDFSADVPSSNIVSLVHSLYKQNRMLRSILSGEALALENIPEPED